MARRSKTPERGDWLFPNVTSGEDVDRQSSLLDALDNVLNRGALVTGDIVLGVADVDLIYLKLSVLLAALDKVTRSDPVFTPIAAGPRKRSRRAKRKKR
jgi:hypothetical protein